jgi:phosphatidylethanolamine N-methyltransferase
MQSQSPSATLFKIPHLAVFGNLLAAAGGVLVVSSMWRLGITGTYLGDYFGLLKKERVTGFPFNLMDNPMYNGSTLVFLGQALSNYSVVGLLLSIEVYLIYRVALVFEEPFTARIYSKIKK